MITISTIKFLMLIISFSKISASANKSQLHTKFEESTYTTEQSDYEYNYEIPDFPMPLVANISGYDCEEKICIVKCCPKDQFYYFSIIESPHPKCLDVALFNIKDWYPKIKDEVTLIYGLPSAIHEADDVNLICSPYEETDFDLRNDGRVFFKRQSESFDQRSYCIDWFHEDDKLHLKALICHRILEMSQYNVVTDILHTVAVVLSCCFLFLLLLFFAITPHYLDLQKKCTLSCCVNLFGAYFMLFINRTSVVHIISMEGCVSLAIITQFFFLAFYFWLNITCFEISRIIRGTFKLQSISDLTGSSTRRFFYYCVYCWGCPLVVCSVTLAMQLVPMSDFPESIRNHIIKPAIDEGSCWIEDGAPQFVYYYIIEIVLHFLNAVFMSYTGYLLYKENILFRCCQPQGTGLRIHASTNYIDEFKQQLRIYIMYLFIWVMNVITLINPRHRFWRIVDMIVALQGVFLFIFIIQTSKTILVLPFYEKLSSTAREFSNHIEEFKTSRCNLRDVAVICKRNPVDKE